MTKYEQIPSPEIINQTAEALRANGMEVFVVEDALAAKQKALELLPKGAEVMTMSSLTLEQTGIAKEINESGNYNPVRSKLMDKEVPAQDKKRFGSAPSFALGSVHALTTKGQAMIASASGSQLPAYAFGAGQVIWVVGAQKIVKDLDDGFRRIYDYVLPLEDARARKAYGVGSGVNKVLIINQEEEPGRLKFILVKEKLGF